VLPATLSIEMVAGGPENVLPLSRSGVDQPLIRRGSTFAEPRPGTLQMAPAPSAAAFAAL
jgi:hypothetical protein